MKLIRLLPALCLLVASTAYAADEDCPAAVDAAETQNPNAFKNCDYSDKGLNGVLHRALGKKNESNTSDKDVNNKKEMSDKKVESKTIEVVETKPADIKAILASGEFSNPQQLQNLRFALVQKAAQECVKGFVVQGEKFMPAEGKALKLELFYHCL